MKTKKRATAHPRMRGEHHMQQGIKTAQGGSSPHARGARRRLRCRAAGSPAHPRMRGEHPGATGGVALGEGSSPHARGAHCRGADGELGGRLIPACAGSTQVAPPRRRWGPAHPRMRGEHGGSARSLVPGPGSSPHARGALLPGLHHPQAPRLIPACAGSTRTGSSSRPRPAAHPRMRGEHPTPAERQFRSVGSSPHARGALCPGTR